MDQHIWVATFTTEVPPSAMIDHELGTKHIVAGSWESAVEWAKCLEREVPEYIKLIELKYLSKAN